MLLKFPEGLADTQGCCNSLVYQNIAYARLDQQPSLRVWYESKQVTDRVAS